ncbi:hypothetical protein Syun_024038 [Stephania yunnanensis]|uniref:Uncharacterized protein n=1 Tax=Stephania yunnanensis TaxID=152371 RepID=A0AAP0I2N6_9MAGN
MSTRPPFSTIMDLLFGCLERFSNAAMALSCVDGSREHNRLRRCGTVLAFTKAHR